MRSIFKQTVLGFLALATVGSSVVQAPADPLAYRDVDGASPQPVAGAGLTTTTELETFMDGVMESQFELLKLVGATITVVKDGEIFFAKGYGHEDFERNIPMDPAKSLVRPGSVSKLFTWTAVMQLVEAGVLDLDTDVNEYLHQFQIPDTFADPVTLRNLMTHSAGFEDGAVGFLMARNEDDILPLAQSLERHMPERVLPPVRDFTSGTGVAYSNWGAALAGLIVANVSGLSFEDYVDQHIFDPLGMNRSSFREPPPPPLLDRMAKGYVDAGGQPVAQGFEYNGNLRPAGAMSATANDMARFMMAHLQKGTYGNARILKPETAELMQTRVLSPDPHVDGLTPGFYETHINGTRTIGHGGAMVFFHTESVLIPDANVGLFVSYNTQGGARAHGGLKKAFMDRYFPAQLPEVTKLEDTGERIADYGGTYRGLRRSHNRMDKVLSALGDISVTPMPDQSLLIRGILGQTAHWHEVKPDVFRKRHDGSMIAFKRDNAGRVSHLLGPLPVVPAERISWYQTLGFHGLLMGFCAVLFLAMIVSVIARRKQDAVSATGPRRARRVLAVSSILGLLFLLIGLPSLVLGMSELLFSVPVAFKVALTLALLMIPVMAIVLMYLVKAWRNRYWTVAGRLHYSLTAVAAILFLLILNYWNLIGYNYG